MDIELPDMVAVVVVDVVQLRCLDDRDAACSRSRPCNYPTSASSTARVSP